MEDSLKLALEYDFERIKFLRKIRKDFNKTLENLLIEPGKKVNLGKTLLKRAGLAVPLLLLGGALSNELIGSKLVWGGSDGKSISSLYDSLPLESAKRLDELGYTDEFFRFNGPQVYSNSNISFGIATATKAYSIKKPSDRKSTGNILKKFLKMLPSWAYLLPAVALRLLVTFLYPSASSWTPEETTFWFTTFLYLYHTTTILGGVSAVYDMGTFVRDIRTYNKRIDELNSLKEEALELFKDTYILKQLPDEYKYVVTKMLFDKCLEETYSFLIKEMKKGEISLVPPPIEEIKKKVAVIKKDTTLSYQ